MSPSRGTLYDSISLTSVKWNILEMWDRFVGTQGSRRKVGIASQDSKRVLVVLEL